MKPNMSKSIVIVFAVTALLIPTALAADVDFVVTRPEEGTEYTLDGQLVINISVTNEGGNDSTGVTVSATKEGLSIYSTSNVNIPAGQSASLSLVVSGTLCKATTLAIDVIGSDAEGKTHKEKFSIKLKPPEKDLEILYPQGTIKLVDMAPGGARTFEVLVKNMDLDSVSGITLVANYNPERITCTVSSATQTVPGKSTATYPMTCTGIDSGDRVDMQLRDNCNSVVEVGSAEFEIVERVKDYRLQIVSPLENEQVRVSGDSGVIPVIVSAIGSDDLTGVCVYAENISSASDACADISSGQNHTFSLTVYPTNDLTNFKITVKDGTGLADDAITVWIFKVPPVQTVTLVQVVNQTSNQSNGTASIGEEGTQGSLGIPQEALVLMIILIPILVLSLYIRKSLQNTRSAE